MARKKYRPERLDRFETHRRLVRWLPTLKDRTGGDAAGLLMLVLWDIADGNTGEILYATVTRLARDAGLQRPTVRAALAALLHAKIIERCEGEGHYMMPHDPRKPPESRRRGGG